MKRNLDNIFISEQGEQLKYAPINGSSGKKNYPIRSSRKLHGNYIENQFKKAWLQAQAAYENRLAVSAPDKDGVYLQIKGKAGYDLVTKSLEHAGQGVRLMNVCTDTNEVVRATVFVPTSKHDFFIKKIKKYMENDKGMDVITTIENIEMAMLDAFWIGDNKSIPNDEECWCEVWLRFENNEDIYSIKIDFFELCNELKIKTKHQHILFPERLVVGVKANRQQLSELLEYSSRIAEFRKMISPTDFYLSLSVAEQREFSEDLGERINTENITDTAVCLIDTGVNNGHPILSKILSDNDRHTINLSRGVEDKASHGTRMAGIAAFNTLEDKLDTTEKIVVRHFLESVKMLDNSYDNPSELYGDLTSEAITLAEIQNPNINRAICMAITADSDIEKDGRPSSWSGAIDTIISGANEEDVKRLMFISAGNTSINDIVESGDYKTAIINNSVKDPAQAWNAITVGAYTKLDCIDDPQYNGYVPIAEYGDISPFTSTSMLWNHKKWPIKPEIMFEGGNLSYNNTEDFYSEAPELSLLTTGHQYMKGKPFDTISMTSSATAQASYMAANIWSYYPNMWPETVRALMIHSAYWTESMMKNISNSGTLSKMDYRKLLRMCGYGVPNLERALWSASNSVNLILEDELTPFIKKASNATANEMHIHTLPWPTKLLAEYENTPVIMRVTLSYYIEPGPGEIGWKDKYRYPSCGLCFDVNNPTEDRDNFTKRISKAMREDENDKNEIKNDSSRWMLGVNNRNVGSIHSDIWEGTASQLSECNMVMVYPKTGWWKLRTNLKKYDSTIRYSLIVTIEAPKTEIDLYTQIKTEIKNKTVSKTEITAI